MIGGTFLLKYMNHDGDQSYIHWSRADQRLNPALRLGKMTGLVLIDLSENDSD
jgi:hypothetical protein